MQKNNKLTLEAAWPDKPEQFPPVMTPTEAAQFLRLDQTSHTPKSAKRTLDYWRNRGDLKGSKCARHVWYIKDQLEVFLKRKTEA